MIPQDMSFRLDLTPPEGRRFLPEGLQMVVHQGKVMMAGVCIQLGRESRNGSLWFHDPATGTTTFAAIAEGRPGWFRPTTQPDIYVVGLEDRIALYRVKDEFATLEKVLATAPDIASPRIMVNDGCVAPNGTDIICGFKDYNFDQKAQLAFTMCYHTTDSKFERIMSLPETCANGNGFLTIEGQHHLLHIDTGAQALYAVPFPPNTQVAPKVLINFKDAEFFKRFGAEDLYHDKLMPDGLCQWHVRETKQDKIIVAIFDPRDDQLRDGICLQFDVTNGRVNLEHAYKVPHSPRVTHPAIFQATPDSTPEIWVTTADEGIVGTLGPGVATRNVGAVFVCPADAGKTGLVANSSAWTIGNYALKV